MGQERPPSHLHTEKDLELALDYLAARDGLLAPLVATHRPLPLRTRPAGFLTLTKLVLEQQVSQGSADAAWRRLGEGLGPVSPALFVEAGETGIRAQGITGAKARTLVGLGEAWLAGLSEGPPEDLRARLLALKGIGPWTADTYRLLALREADAFLEGDLALQQVIGVLYDGVDRVSAKRCLEVAEAWRPVRGAAVLLLWTHYRRERNQEPAARVQA